MKTSELQDREPSDLCAKLIQALCWALEWIDAVPDEIASVLPTMPGFDRDYVNELVESAKRDTSRAAAAIGEQMEKQA